MVSAARFPRCVLCATCANRVGARKAGERRGFPRVCKAGLALGPELFECDSYVRRSDERRKAPRGAS